MTTHNQSDMHGTTIRCLERCRLTHVTYLWCHPPTRARLPRHVHGVTIGAAAAAASCRSFLPVLLRSFHPGDPEVCHLDIAVVVHEQVGRLQVPVDDALGVKVPAPCTMHHAPCNMQYATCNMQHATCNMQHAICNMQYAICNMQYAICNMQYAPCNMQYAICNMHHAPCTMHHAPCTTQCGDSREDGQHAYDPQSCQHLALESRRVTRSFSQPIAPHSQTPTGFHRRSNTEADTPRQTYYPHSQNMAMAR